MKIMSAILWLSLVPIFGSGPVAAQEKDPFFPAGPRSSVTAPVPQNSDWGRDPFARPFEGKEQAGQSSGAGERGLTGIICNRNDCLAIIGGETYRVGSMVNDRKVVDIRRRSVVVKNSSGDREEMFLEDFSMRK